MKNTCLSVLASLGFAALALVSAPAFAQTSPSLGAAGSYSVLAGTQITNSGSTTLSGDFGVGPGSSIDGGITSTGGAQRSTTDANLAQIDNSAAFDNLDQTPCTQSNAGVWDLTGENLVAGIYCASAFQLTGTLNLSGSGVWIFKSASTLVTFEPGANIVGGDPCNIWWRVGSSATIAANTTFKGNILALTTISLGTNAVLDGRALAQEGAVNLLSNTIGGPVCDSSGGVTPTPGAGEGGDGGSGSGTPVPTLPVWALIMLTALLALAGFAAMRRRAM